MRPMWSRSGKWRKADLKRQREQERLRDKAKAEEARKEALRPYWPTPKRKPVIA